MIVTLLVFLVILSVLVLIHELGHFLVARFFGIKVEEFGFGFPPQLVSKKVGETVYSLNALPIGGFVKLYGEDEAGAGRVSLSEKKHSTKDIKRAFFARPAWQRALVVFAGVVMNFFLAAFIYYIFLGLSGFKTDLPIYPGATPHNMLLANQTIQTDVLVTNIAKDSPAAKAGIKEGWEIIGVNGEQIVSSTQFTSLIKKAKGKPVTLTLRNAQTKMKKSVTLTPRIHPPKGQGALGIAFFPIDKATLDYHSPVQKTLSGFIHPINLMIYNADVISALVRDAVKTKNAAPLSDAVSGPVGIYKVVGTFVQIPDARERLMQLLNLMGLLSISLAFFNVLPIPALDGGRLFFILIELVSGKKINPRIESLVNTAGMVVLLALIAIITFKDLL